MISQHQQPLSVLSYLQLGQTENQRENGSGLQGLSSVLYWATEYCPVPRETRNEGKDYNENP